MRLSAKLIKSIIVFCFIFSFFLLFVSQQFASQNFPSITVINLIRGNELGHEKDDLYKSLKDQYAVTKELNVNATWLLQYSVLENKNIVNFAKNEMKNQELGLLFEIDRNSAAKAKVAYRGQGPWYFSDGLFLTSYDKAERKKLIDTAFGKFKKEFGYYPKTVGAWWMGADSLVYMQQKYGIVACLKAADQFELDFYSIWGSPWSIPYLASYENEAIPADNFNDSSKVVILQWAARDPAKGYKDPLFSIQDYPIKSYDSAYVDHLSSIFLKKPTDNIVIGLENGGNRETFEKYYKEILIEGKKLESEKKASLVLVRDYADNFLSQKRVMGATHYFLSKDFKSDDQSFWYNSINYRAGILKEEENIYLVDLHDYANKVEEDYLYLPNSQSRLKITTPEIVDSLRAENQKILIAKSSESMKLKEEGEEVTLFVANKKIANFTESKVQIFINDGTKVFSFNPVNTKNNILNALILIYAIYFALIYVRGKKSLIHVLLLSAPLFVASFFLIFDPAFAFDKKELFLLNLLPTFSFISIKDLLIVFKLLPFVVLLFMHYLCFILKPQKINKIMFFVFLVFITFLYFHFPYFPLDRSSLKIILIVSGLTGTVLFSLSIFYWIRSKSIKLLLVSFIAIFFMGILLGVSVLTSRTKYILTPFEMQSLQMIRNQEKDVIFVEQIDNSVVPIYKAVKPLYFEVGEKLTGKKWENIMRPEDNILKLNNYDNKIIVIARFLGADLSLHEMETLHLKKIFDNAQIAIYEKK